MSNVFSLKPLGLGLAADDGILRAELAGAVTGADLILAEARKKAEDILADAHQAFEAEKRRGHAEGMAEAQAEAAAWLHEARADLDLRLDRMQGEMAELVHLCVKRIVHSFDDRTLALETVRSALASLRSEKRLQLYVAPSVESDVRAELPKYLADYPEIELVDVIADPALHAPSVRLESELGVVTSVLDDTLSQLGRLLRGQ